MREFLSARNVPFTERNIRRDPAAKAELLDLTGQLVVPVVVSGGRHIVGYDPEWIESILYSGEPRTGILPPRDSASLEQGVMAAQVQDDLPATIVDLLARVREELQYNAAKGTGPYRQGMHDGLRFTHDALVDILTEAGVAADFGESPAQVAQMDA